MVAYVLDLFDQFYPCILVYEQLVCDRDKVVKEFDDQVVVLQRSSTVKDKDLNGVNTRYKLRFPPFSSSSGLTSLSSSSSSSTSFGPWITTFHPKHMRDRIL